MLKNSASLKIWLAWIVLGVGLLSAIAVSHQVKQNIEQEAESRFAHLCDQIILKIQERLEAYALVLRGGSALFAASKSIERKDWQAYVETLRAGRNVPGVQGIGFAQVIPADRLAAHIARIRGEGFSEYTVHPAGERVIYTPVVYIEPFQGRNPRAFGYDMHSEPVRRAAMEQARDTGEAALTGKVELVQETGAHVQAGVLMYVPVYRNGMPVGTVGHKRTALIGWVYSTYRMNDLMSDILRDRVVHEGANISLHIYDGLQATPAALLFDSKSVTVPDWHPLFHQQRTIDFNGQHWLLAFEPTEKSPAVDYTDAWATLLGGLSLSMLLFGLMLSELGARANAVGIAERLTEEIRQNLELLKENEFRWKYALEGSGAGLWDWHIADGTLYFSKIAKEMLGTHRDITERKASEAALAESHDLLQTIIDTVPIRIFWKDLNLRYLGCNMAVAKDAGFAHSDDLVGKDDYQMAWAAQAELYRADDKAVLESEIAKLSYDEPQTTPDGQTIWLRTSKVVLRNQDNEAIGLLGIYEDITERKQTENKLLLAASVFTHAREGIMITEPDGTIIDANDAFSSITGYRRDEVLGCNLSILSNGPEDKLFYTTIWRDLIEQGYWYGEAWNRRKSGEMYAVMQTISAVPDINGNTQQYVALFSDITSLKEYEKRLENIAHYDALTGLPNRALLSDRLRQGMVQSRRREQQLAVAFLDLDGFKAINDNHGHNAGDQLLIAVASRMEQTLREGDTLARMGGDEFVAVLLDLSDIETSLPMLSRLLAAAAQPVVAGELILQVSASLGVTFYPQSADIEADQLLRQADQAMYQAKLAGKNRYHVFDSEQDGGIRSHFESLDDIRTALTAREFVLYYQPMVNMRTGAIIGAEALVRWQHPGKGLLPPAVFLPVIENHPLAIELGEWVINNVLLQMELWQAAGLKIPISINIGARQLQQADFVERLYGLLAAHPTVSPGDLELEVLETSAIGDLAKVSQVIDAGRKTGVSFSLDDFGTGYSSLTYLKRLPVTQIKIDQRFVRGMLENPDDLAILEGVLGLGAAFHHQVVAEGVETVEHGEMLLKFGCELAQGYGIARPMPASELPDWLATWQPDPAWVSSPSVSRSDLP